VKRQHKQTTHKHGLAALVLAAAMAHAPMVAAQMADALGKPLPVGTMSKGTVSVRVIAGAPDKPLIGIDVKLVSPDGSERTARTDGEGRASFTGLKPGDRYVARAEEAQESEAAGEPRQATSEQFIIPDQGGLRLMISTRSWQGGGGPAAGGAAGGMPGGMPGGAGAMDPRQMSGVPRGDPAVQAGQMTVAAVRGMVTNRIPGQTIHLVGYGADGSVVRMSKETDAEGRATFDHLKTGIMAYYAMTTFTRIGPGGEQILDRVRSEPVTLPPQVGIRLMLAGLPEDSREPPVEDLERIGMQKGGGPGEGVVHTRLTFTADARVPDEFVLFEIPEGEGAPVRVATAPIMPPTPVDVIGSVGDAIPQGDLAAGAVSVTVAHEGQRVTPMPGVSVELVAMAAAQGEPALQLVTDAQGGATFTGLAPGSQHRAVIDVFGKRIESAPFTVPAAGGLRLSAAVSTRVISSGDVRFAGVAPGKLYYVEAQFEGRLQRTPPFHTLPGRGAEISLILHSRPLLSFHINGWIDDAFMGFSGQVSIFNTSSMPWNPGREGIVIPLPKGFIGGRVDEEMATQVKLDPDRGLLWRGVLPPGNVQFVSGFSLPVQDGKVQFAQDLPFGVFNSSLVMLKNPGMQLIGLPPGVRAFDAKARNGRDMYVINNINIPEGQSMVFTIAGLPHVPASQRYTRWLVGGLVVVLLAWAMTIIFIHRPREALVMGGKAADKGGGRKLAREREELLDQLVDLEAKKKRGEVTGEAYERARGRLKKQLESVYAELERSKGSSSAA
jgi:hypothetical protein